MPYFSHHLTPHLSLIELSHFPVHIRLSLAGIWSPKPPEPSKEKEQLLSTIGDATVTIFFPCFRHDDLHPLRTPPTLEPPCDPLGTPEPRRDLPTLSRAPR